MLLLAIFTSTNLCAQNNNQNSDNAYDVSIISKGQGRILCNEQFFINNNDRKEFTLKNNADLILNFSPNTGCRLLKFTINGINKIHEVANNRITLKNISKKTVIVATFGNEEESVILTVVSGSGGTLYYNGESITNSKRQATVRKGSKINLRWEPQKDFRVEKLSINGMSIDVTNNTYSFEIQRNSVVNAEFSAPPSVAISKGAEEEMPRFRMSVSGLGKAVLSGAVHGIVAGNPENPLSRNNEDFYVPNGSAVTIKLDPVQNIKSFIIGSQDLTQTIKASNGVYTVGVTHEFPKFGLTSAFAEFAQRHKIEITNNEYGSSKVSGNTQKTGTSNYYLIDDGKKIQLWLSAKAHCHLEKLTINGADMSKNVSPSSTVVTGGGPTYDFDLGTVEKDYKIVATFAPDPKLTIICGQYGSADRAQSTSDPTKSIYYLDPDYGVKSGMSKTFYEPSAAKGSAFYRKPWIIRTISNEGYELARLVINGVDMTTSVNRIAPDGARINRECCYKSLGFIKQDTKVEITFKKTVPQSQEFDWVDLGTGVKWATRNVGANSITDGGRYYSWKEANALKLQKGRLPTYEEAIRLIKECHPEFTQLNGVNGIRFYHRSNRSISIFIPAAGIYEPLIHKGEEGEIWTSSLCKRYEEIAECLKKTTWWGALAGHGLHNLSEEHVRMALGFSLKNKIVKADAEIIDARLNVRLVLD